MGTTPHIEQFVQHYREHRDSFIFWAAKHFGADKEEAKDAFQQAVCVLYEKAVQGKLDDFNGQISTYLFAIGRNVLLDRFRQQQTHGNHIQRYAIHLSAEKAVDSAQERMEKREEQACMRRAMAELGEKDRRILELYYLEGLKMQEIAEVLGYKNANLVKKKKFYAMKKLMEVMRKFMVLLVVF